VGSGEADMYVGEVEGEGEAEAEAEAEAAEEDW
jgi:hypothetical protein